MRRSAAAIIAVLCSVTFAAPASADIASFNAAIKAADFKKAAAEAATTWPTLDKSRDDIEVIAREFGFAAYMASDYAQARTLGEFAAMHAPTADVPADFHVASQVLFRMADLKAQPSPAARNQLFATLRDRAALTGLDNISFIGADALVAYDLKSGDWKLAQESTSLAARLTAASGGAYLAPQRKFELYAAVTEYMQTKKPAAYDKLAALQKNITNDIDAAPTDEQAAQMVPFYWEASAWLNSINIHLSGRMVRHGLDGKGEIYTAAEKAKVPSERETRLLGHHEEDYACTRDLKMKPEIEYPKSAMYQGLIGSVIVTLDIDDQGRASNPKILAAVPEKAFAQTVIDGVGNLRFSPGAKWDASRCKLADKDHKITFQFAIGF